MQANIGPFYKIVASFCFWKSNFIILEAKLVSMPTYHLKHQWLQKKVHNRSRYPFFSFKRDIWTERPKFGCVCRNVGACTSANKWQRCTSCMLANIVHWNFLKQSHFGGTCSDSGKTACCSGSIFKGASCHWYCLNDGYGRC